MRVMYGLETLMENTRLFIDLLRHTHVIPENLYIENNFASFLCFYW